MSSEYKEKLKANRKRKRYLRKTAHTKTVESSKYNRWQELKKRQKGEGV